MVLRIEDKTDENSHPDLIYLEAYGPEIPEGYEIVFSNSSYSYIKGELQPVEYAKNGGWWTWYGPEGFDGGWETAEQCLEELLEFKKDI